jgi:hypothetical protein
MLRTQMKKQTACKKTWTVNRENGNLRDNQRKKLDI